MQGAHAGVSTHFPQIRCTEFSVMELGNWRGSLKILWIQGQAEGYMDKDFPCLG